MKAKKIIGKCAIQLNDDDSNHNDNDNNSNDNNDNGIYIMIISNRF